MFVLVWSAASAATRCNKVPSSVASSLLFHSSTQSLDSCLPATALVSTDATSLGAVSLIDAHGFNTHNIDVTLYPSLVPSGAAPLPAFPAAAAALVDVLRMSAVGSSLFLMPGTQGQLTAPSFDTQPLGVLDAGELGLSMTPDQLLASQQQQMSSSEAALGKAQGHCMMGADLTGGLLPCSSVNALFTLSTHFLAGGCEYAAAQPVIGRTDSPMAGVVCLQSPPLATH